MNKNKSKRRKESMDNNKSKRKKESMNKSKRFFRKFRKRQQSLRKFKPKRSFRRRWSPIKPGDQLNYRNVSLITRFVTKQGKILSRRVNRITLKQQRLITIAIKRARILSLLPFINNPAAKRFHLAFKPTDDKTRKNQKFTPKLNQKKNQKFIPKLNQKKNQKFTPKLNQKKK